MEVFLMAWLELLLAGGLEVFWSTFMKLSEGFTRPLYTVLTLIGLVLSFLFLSQATRVLPLGTAYAIWTGIGAVGAVVVGIVIFREPVTALRMVFVILLLTGIIGLKATSGH
jgi:quaternary ammonium compound-resistance protein SugE